jgi:hypothetical protein
MKRLQDWQIRFEAFCRERISAPFAWGRNDCCTFAADAVQAMTGQDPAPHLRSHATELQAARVIKEQGGIAAIATAALGEPRPTAFGAIGDIVLANIDGRETLTVCNGTNLLAPGVNGMMTVGMETAVKCWRVG